MKTIVETSSGLSKYLFADDVQIVSSADNIVVGSPIQFTIGDLNNGNATITNNVTNAPSDWVGNKYFFNGSTWTQNQNWVDPDTISEE